MAKPNKTPAGDAPEKPAKGAGKLRLVHGGEPPAPASDDAHGEIKWGGRIAFIFFGLFGAWAALAPLDAGVVAPGIVKVSGNRQTIQHRDGGIVSRLVVKEGDKVKAGDVLIELATTELSAQDKSLTSQAIELEATRARLRAEVSGAAEIARPVEWADLPESYAAAADAVLARQTEEMGRRRAALSSQEGVLSERGQQLVARIGGYEKRVASVKEQIRLMDEELTGLRSLADKGLVPLNRIREKERAEADLQGSLGAIEGSILEAREAIGETRMQMIATRQSNDKDIAEQMRLTESQLAELSPRVAAVRQQLALARVRAPVDGTVVGLKIFTVGGVVRGGDPIMDIVPEAQPLVVEARVRPQDADDVRKGQKTEVRFTAFSSRQMPVIHGEVARLSADRFDDQRTGQGYFLAEVVVPREELDRAAKKSGQLMNLSAGLPVDVVIPLRKRTALQYLLEPLNQTLWRSFREH